MKKSIFKMSLIALVLGGITSCGGGSTETNELTIRSQGVEGEFEDAIEIVSKEVLVKGDYTTDCTVEVKVIGEESMEGYEADLELHLLSEQGNVISSMDMNYSQREKLTRLLSEGSGSMRVDFEGYDQLSDKIKGFKIETIWEDLEDESDYSEDGAEESSSEGGNISSEEVDDMLDSYDDYMDSYVSLAKKMQDDPSNSEIMSEYTEYMKKATDLADKLEKCKGDMSTKQIQRMMKIQSRMAEAM